MNLKNELSYETQYKVKKLTDDAIEKLRIEQRNHDEEAAHSHADKILTDFLTELGFEQVVLAWKKVPKWYA